MRRSIKPFEGCDRGDQLAWLVLRVIEALSPCTKTSLIAYLAAEVRLTTFTPHTQKLLYNSLLKLKGLAFIRFAQEQIAITDDGRRFLSELQLVALRRDARSANTSESPSGTVEEINRALPAPWTRFIALLRGSATTLLANDSPRLGRFCQNRLAGTCAVAQQGFPMNGVRAWDTALEVWRRKIAPIVGSRATSLMTRLARLCGSCGHCDNAENRRFALEGWEGPLSVLKCQARGYESASHLCRCSLAGRPVHCWWRCSSFRQTGREHTRGSSPELTRVSNNLV